MGVRVREKPKGSGVWWVFVHHKGERCSEKIGTQRRAERAAEAILDQIKVGRFTMQPAPAPLLSEYFQKFDSEYLKTACTQATRESYEQNFRIHILPELGHRRLNEIDRAAIKSLIAKLVMKTCKQSDPKKEGANKKGSEPKTLAKASIRIVLSELCKVLSDAMEENLIQSNPALRVGKFYKAAAVRHEDIQPLTDEEVPIFLEKVAEYSPQHFTLFLAAIHTGLRSGELAGLQWADIDFRGKFLTVRRQAKNGKVGRTKTSQIRRVDLSDLLVAELVKHRDIQGRNWRSQDKEPSEWVFANQAGNPPDMKNIKERHFLKCLDKAELRRIRFHDLRHTFASLHLQRGESPAWVQKQMGHSSIRVTVDVYGHLIPDKDRAAANKMPGIQSPDNKPWTIAK